jgi:tetratricopeptide (TPR) repeat protein
MTSSPIDQAIRLFQDENYQQVISLLDTGSLDDTGRFLVGIAYKEMGNYMKAIPFLESILEETNSDWEDEATWELGMIALKRNDRENAEKYLKWLIDNGHKDGIAKKILKQMEKIAKSNHSSPPTSDTLPPPQVHSSPDETEKQGHCPAAPLNNTPIPYSQSA